MRTSTARILFGLMVSSCSRNAAVLVPDAGAPPGDSAPPMEVAPDVAADLAPDGQPSGGPEVAFDESPTGYLLEDSLCQPGMDVCQPGTTCLEDWPDPARCLGRCSRPCQSDADCPGERKCAVALPATGGNPARRVCTRPPEDCHPWRTGNFFPSCKSVRDFSENPAVACYLVSAQAHGDLTTCLCAGSTRLGQPCTQEHECEPGAECILASGARICRRLCEVGKGSLVGGCLEPETCTLLPGATRYGYCL